MTGRGPSMPQLAHEAAPSASLGRFAQRMLRASSGTPLTAAEPLVFGAVQGRLDGLLAHASPVQLLDAGCGQNRPVPVAKNCYVVGVDLSEGELLHNTAVNEAIVGDIQTCVLGSSRFDAVLCWNVLEHLVDPRAALGNLVSALKPGGVLILAVPHPFSIKGIVTRFTPFWFHRWVWDHLLDRSLKAEPFPTVMSSSIAPGSLRTFAHEHGLSVALCSEYEGWEQKLLRSRLRLTGKGFRGIQVVVRALSFGTVTAAVTDVVFVLRKQDA